MNTLSVLLVAQIMRASSLVEIPTSFYPDRNFFWQVNVTTSFSNDGSDQDLKLNFLLYKRWAIGLNVFTFKDFSIDVGYLAIPERLGMPAISFGLRNITYRKYINAGGGGSEPETGFPDERYRARNPEFFSFYGVMSKHITPDFSVHFGFGRGEFIGYGPRSKYLNTDIFSSSRHQYFTLGIFGGIEFTRSIFNLAVEVDGRDLNVGISFDFGKFRFMLAGLKLEHLLFNSTLNPRFGIGFEVNSDVIETFAQPVEVSIYIKNKEENTPVKGAVIKFLNTEIEPLVTDEDGKAQGLVMPGEYMISIVHPEYKGLKAKLKIKRNKPLSAKIALAPKISKRMLAGKKIKEGDALFIAGKLLEAKRAYEDALRIYPKSKTAKERLANVTKAIKNRIIELKSRAKYFERKGDYRSAINYLKEVLQISPQDPDALDKIAELENKLKAPPPPKKKVVKKPTAPKKPSKAQIEKTLNKAIQAFNAGNYKEAKRLLKQVLKWEPGNSRAKDYLRRTEARLKLLGE